MRNLRVCCGILALSIVAFPLVAQEIATEDDFYFLLEFHGNMDSFREKSTGEVRRTEPLIGPLSELMTLFFPVSEDGIAEKTLYEQLLRKSYQKGNLDCETRAMQINAPRADEIGAAIKAMPQTGPVAV